MKRKPHNPLLVEVTAAASPQRQETFCEVAGSEPGATSPAGGRAGAPFKEPSAPPAPAAQSHAVKSRPRRLCSALRAPPGQAQGADNRREPRLCPPPTSPRPRPSASAGNSALLTATAGGCCAPHKRGETPTPPSPATALQAGVTKQKREKPK